MPKYTKQQLEAQYEKLPDVLKDAIFSPEIAEKMFELGKKHGLTMEKTGFAAEETGFVILGLLPPRDFASSLASRLDIDAEKATALASDINHQVFFPLREALKDAHQIEIGEAAIRNEEALPRRVAAPTSIENQELKIKDGAPAPAAPAPQAAPPVSRPAPTPIPVKPPAEPPAPAPSPIKPTPPPTPPTPSTIQPMAPRPSIMTPPIPQKKSSPIVLAPLTPAPQTNAPTPVQKPPEAPKATEQKKPLPIVLRPKFADDLAKEIAPLISGISTPAPAGFLTRKETERIVAEKLAEQKPPPPIPKEPTPAAMPPAPTPSPQPAPSPTPLPPSIPAQPITPPPAQEKTPTPITLAPLAGVPAPTPATAPPLGTPKVPTLDLRTIGMMKREEGDRKEPTTPVSPPPAPKRYEGFDPYKESVE